MSDPGEFVLATCCLAAGVVIGFAFGFDAGSKNKARVNDAIIKATIAAEAGTPMAKLIEHDDGTREWVVKEANDE